jgi:cysteinyl-tRNA synthetase
MSLALLGEGFDLHGGGQDLIFPHHENERAQAVALGKRFSRHWMHNGMVQARGGEKMSKSLGNVLLLSELFEQVPDARAYRLLVLQSHYRAPVEVTSAILSDAQSALGRLDVLRNRLEGAGGTGGELDDPAGGDAREARSAGEGVRTAFCERMQDDLDTPGATAVLFDAIRRANVAFDSREVSRGAALGGAVLECFGAVGLQAAGALEVPDSVLELGRRRDLARTERDFATADGLRAEIVRLGYLVEDGPEGTRIRR